MPTFRDQKSYGFFDSIGFSIFLFSANDFFTFRFRSLLIWNFPSNFTDRFTPLRFRSSMRSCLDSESEAAAAPDDAIFGTFLYFSVSASRPASMHVASSTEKQNTTRECMRVDSFSDHLAPPLPSSSHSSLCMYVCVHYLCVSSHPRIHPSHSFPMAIGPKFLFLSRPKIQLSLFFFLSLALPIFLYFMAIENIESFSLTSPLLPRISFSLSRTGARLVVENPRRESPLAGSSGGTHIHRQRFCRFFSRVPRRRRRW